MADDTTKTFGEVGGGSLNPRFTGFGMVRPGGGAQPEIAPAQTQATVRQSPKDRFGALHRAFSGVGRLFQSSPDLTEIKSQIAQKKAENEGLRIMKKHGLLK